MLSKSQVTRIAAYGLVVQEHRILLCRLSRHQSLDPGRWTLPGGGLEFGEDPSDAMAREVYEETGLVVRPRGIAGIDSLRIEEAQRDFHSIRIIYHSEQTDGALRNELNGSTDLCAWWTLEEARTLPLVELGSVGLGLAFADST